MLSGLSSHFLIFAEKKAAERPVVISFFGEVISQNDAFTVNYGHYWSSKWCFKKRWEFSAHSVLA